VSAAILAELVEARCDGTFTTDRSQRREQITAGDDTPDQKGNQLSDRKIESGPPFVLPVLLSLLHSLQFMVRSRASLHLEIIALRHQLAVMHRSSPPRLRLTSADRVLWAWLSQAWSGWRSAVHIVRPETVIAWHRRGFRQFWRRKSRRHTGRPGVPPDVRALIRELSTANPLWGAPRIHGELQ
jgi:hypothetical protein